MPETAGQSEPRGDTVEHGETRLVEAPTQLLRTIETLDRILTAQV